MTAAPVDTGTWIRRFHRSPAATTRLVCFPHAGGSASYFFPVSRALAPRVEVLAVQYPGRQDRRAEPCVDDVHELADLVSAELRGWTDKPWAVFGHSLGASLGFEVARRLEAEGSGPVRLFASGRRAPSRWRDENQRFLDDAGLAANLSRMSGTDSAVLGDPDMLRAILPAVRADYHAAETYRLRSAEPLACPVTVLTGDADPEVTLDEARAWEGHTTAAFTLRVFRGGHFYLTEHAAAVIAEIRDAL